MLVVPTIFHSTVDWILYFLKFETCHDVEISRIIEALPLGFNKIQLSKEKLIIFDGTDTGPLFSNLVFF